MVCVRRGWQDNFANEREQNILTQQIELSLAELGTKNLPSKCAQNPLSYYTL